LRFLLFTRRVTTRRRGAVIAAQSNMTNINYDQFGPEMVVETYDVKTKTRGILVIDNTALGVGKGGIRMTPSVTVGEVSRLARAMTWKNVLAGLPFGGAKSGIIFDPKHATANDKKNVVQSFSRAIKPLCPEKYVAGPDINMGEKDMEWFVKANGQKKSATGKPKKMGGLPHEYGSTGYGVVCAIKEAADFFGQDLKNLTVGIEGFGNVGTFAFKFLEESGAKVCAVADSKGVFYDPDGLKYKEAMDVKKKTGSVINCPIGVGSRREKLDVGGIFGLPVSLIVTAAFPDVINENNAAGIKAKMIVEGANISVTPEAEKRLFERGVLVLPDIVANAGGVISSYAEWKGGYDKGKTFKLIKQKITKSVREVLEAAREKKIMPREAALAIARDKVLGAGLKNK